jgi:hypothetical protein
MQKHMRMQVHVFVNCHLCRGGDKEVKQEAQDPLKEGLWTV